ncbi:MAG: hypothetical protein FWE95_01480 [Planctomycetaceae bacterium]|nr:hypothetical protein [Planctomycetaceae bacterium]
MTLAARYPVAPRCYAPGFHALDENVEQSGLSATVRTDESDFISCSEREANINEHRLGRKVLAEMFDR